MPRAYAGLQTHGHLTGPAEPLEEHAVLLRRLLLRRLLRRLRLLRLLCVHFGQAHHSCSSGQGRGARERAPGNLATRRIMRQLPLRIGRRKHVEMSRGRLARVIVFQRVDGSLVCHPPGLQTVGIGTAGGGQAVEGGGSVRALVQRQARGRHGVARGARTVEVREVPGALRAEALRPLALRHVIITLCKGRLATQAAGGAAVAEQATPVQARGPWVRAAEVAPEVRVVLVRMMASRVAVVRLLAPKESVHRLRLQPPRVQLRVAARVEAVRLHVHAQDRGLAQRAHGRVHGSRRSPRVESRGLKVGVHA